MGVSFFESYLGHSPARDVAAFVAGSEFQQLASVVNTAFPRQLAASFWNLITEEDMTLSWVNGERGSGVGFVIVKDEDLRLSDSGEQVFRPGSIFPELKLRDANNKPGRPVQQLNFQTGNMAIDGHTFPADIVVDRSSRVLAAHYELVSMGRLFGLSVDRKNSIGIKAFQDGDLTCYQGGSYSKEATQRLGDALGRLSLYSALYKVS